MTQSAGQERAQQALARARRRARSAHLYHAANALFVLQWPDFWTFLKFIAQWLVLASIAGALAGTASWIFLTSLAWATATRLANPMLLYALPLVGLIMGWLYYRFGGTASLGNNLVIEEVNSNRSQIPTRMAPLVLLGTIVTHLCGGSAGREGTAIQMGASLADRVRRLLGLTGEDRRLLLMAGISGGFGSVFGVPVAGFVFGMEVQGIGRIRYDGLIPCLIASFVGDFVARALGTPHAHYPALLPTALDPLLMLKVVLAGIAFGLTSIVFIELTHGVKYLVSRLTTWSPLYPVVGGVVVIVLTWLVGTRDYLGLSLPLIADSVEGGDVAPWAFALKVLFTAITLGTGYLGGEVTPLFVIGSTLGNALGGLLAVDPGLLASIGLVAVFAGASNTPLACALMGVELFGSGATPYLFLGCVVAYLASGHRGIYMTQRIHQTKSALSTTDVAALTSDENLRELRQKRGGGWLPNVAALTTPLEAQSASLLMTAPVVTVAEHATLRDVIVKALQAGVRALPVVDADGRVQGIITEQDLQRSPLRTTYHALQLLSSEEREDVLAQGASIPVRAVQQTPAITLPAQATVGDALRLLRTMEIKRLPLVDDKQRLVGMLTRSDILRNLLYLEPTLLKGQPTGDNQTTIGGLPLEPALTVMAQTPLLELLIQMQQTITLHAIVTDERGQAIGMVSESDLLTRTTPAQREAVARLIYQTTANSREIDTTALTDKTNEILASLTVADLMTTPLLSVSPEESGQRAIHLLLEHGIKRLPVISAEGEIRGLLDRRTLLYGLLDGGML